MGSNSAIGCGLHDMNKSFTPKHTSAFSIPNPIFEWTEEKKNNNNNETKHWALQYAKHYAKIRMINAKVKHA